MPARNIFRARLLAAVGTLLILTSAGAATPPPPTPINPRTIGGTVSGLKGLQLILQLNGQNDLEINTNGAFVFGKTLSSGAQYSVTVKQQPHDPAQTCTVTNGKGIVPNANVTNVLVGCVGGATPPPPPPPVFTHFAYVKTDDAISLYAVDGVTGRLHPRGYVTEPGDPSGTDTSVVVEPSGRFAYATNHGPSGSNGSVSAYTVDPVSGELTVIPNSRIAAGIDPYFLGVEPSGNFIYALNLFSDNISVYRIDQTNGRLTALANIPTGQFPANIVFDSTGHFAFVSNKHSASITTFAVDASTGLLSPLSTVAAGNFPFAMVIHPSGNFLYCTSREGGTVSSYRINATTGELTRMQASIAAGDFPWSITTDPRGRFVYVANKFSASISRYTVNPTTGELSARVSVSTESSPSSLSMDPNGKYLLVVGDGSTATHPIDDTGALLPRSVVRTRGIAQFVSTTRGPAPLAVKPLRAFVTNEISNVVSGSLVNATTGGLSFSTAGQAQTPFGIATHPAGRFAYVTRNLDNFLDAYRIDTATGALTAVPGARTAATAPGLDIDPSGRFIYTANCCVLFGDPPPGTVSAFRIDAATGSPIPNGTYSSGQGTDAVIVEPTGQYVYAMNFTSNTIAGFSINRLTGELSAINGSPFSTGGSPSSLVADGGGRFVYVASSLDHSLSGYVIQPHSGFLIPMAGSPFAGGGDRLGADPLGRFVFAAESSVSSNGTLRVFRIESNGALTLVGTPVSIGASPSRVRVDPSGRFVYVAYSEFIGSVDAFEIDATGTLTRVLGAPFFSGGGLSIDLAFTDKIE